MEISIKNKLISTNDVFCLDGDLSLLNKYYGEKCFVKKTSNGFKTLIPQFWWGNINNPKIIILANNPSYKKGYNSKTSDDIDNEKYRKYLEDNIYRPNGFNCDFVKENIDAYFSYWWKTKFFENKEIDITKVGIFNLIGYYSKNSSFFNKEILEHSHMIRFANDLKEYCQSNDDIIIVFVWKGSVDYWRRALGKEKFYEIFKNKDVYIANKNRRFNPKLNGACRYHIDVNKYDESDFLNIDDLIKRYNK